MRTPCLLPAITLLLSLACASAHADAPPSASIAPLDARHVVVLHGDRMVVYEIDPARNHQARVVNTVLFDDEGQIVGQFRPDPAAPAVVPKFPEDSPKTEPQSAPRQPANLMLHARTCARVPRLVARRTLVAARR